LEVEVAIRRQLFQRFADQGQLAEDAGLQLREDGLHRPSLRPASPAAPVPKAAAADEAASDEEAVDEIEIDGAETEAGGDEADETILGDILEDGRESRY